MIPLRINIKMLHVDDVIVFRLRKNSNTDAFSILGYDAVFQYQSGKWAIYELNGLELGLETIAIDQLHNDVIMIQPNSKLGHRLIRANSPHNTLLITEQCDQLCLMCSQPPKTHHVDLFESFFEAVSLAPKGSTIGITGGEPLLHKERLFEFFTKTYRQRPDIQFHVLTNGQHFTNEDIKFLSSNVSKNILWAVPIYSAEEDRHDEIVGKTGAYRRLMESFITISETTSAFELRTVLLNKNVAGLADLANFITTHIPFADFWSIMQLEPIGYGRKVWGSEFVDTSADFSPIARALNIAEARDMNAYLYNFPLCTIPSEFRRFSVRSVSDWKLKYLDFCEPCEAKKSCGGFFEWYKQENGYQKLEIQ